MSWYDIKVRQMMVMAIDYDTTIKDYQMGNGIQAFPDSALGISADVHPGEGGERHSQRYVYQPDKTKQIMGEAGYPDGFTLEVVTEAKFTDGLTILTDYLVFSSDTIQVVHLPATSGTPNMMPHRSSLPLRTKCHQWVNNVEGCL